MKTKQFISIILITIFALMTYAECDKHESYWDNDADLNPINRITVRGGSTILWEGQCSFNYMEWNAAKKKYIAVISRSTMSVTVENRWTGSGTLSKSGSKDQKCDQTVPGATVSGGCTTGSILYKPRLVDDHDIETRAKDDFVILL